MKFIPIETKPFTLLPVGIRPGEVTVYPQGTLNSDAMKVLHAYGLDVSSERNK